MNVKVGNVRKVWLRIKSNDTANSSKPKTENEAKTTFASDKPTYS